MQDKVIKFNNEKNCHKVKMPITARIADVSSEFGELSKEVLKCTNYGTREFITTDAFVMEFGDVMYSLLSLAQETGINAEIALDIALEKYQGRIEKKGTMGSEKKDAD